MVKKIKQPLTKKGRSLGLPVVDLLELSRFYIYYMRPHLVYARFNITAGHTATKVVTSQARHIVYVSRTDGR